MASTYVERPSEYQSILPKCLYKTFALLLVFLVFGFPMTAHADNGNTIVHVTRTGNCYHSEGCGYLHSDIEITLADAVEQGYTPCSRCKPPIYDGNGKEESNKTVTKNQTETESQNKTTGTKTTEAKTIVKKVVYVKEKDTPHLPWICGTIITLYLIYKGSKVYVELRKEKLQQREAAVEYERKRQFFLEQYFGKDPLSLVEVPEGVVLKDGLPCTVDFGRSPYGEYTVYVGQNAEVLHFNSNCGGGKLRPINYYEARNLRHCKRCAVGKQKLPKLDWYIKYLEIKKIKEEYNIP